METMHEVKKLSGRTKHTLREELEVKRKNLKEHEARLSGLYSIALGRNYISIDEEIRKKAREIKERTIEMDNFFPMQPQWKFENNEEYLTIQREKINEVITSQNEVLEALHKQKERILIEMPQIQERINDIEKSLGMDLTLFEKV